MGLKRERGIRRSSGIDSVSLAGPGLRAQVLPGGRRILTADLPRRRATSAATGALNLVLTKTRPAGYTAAVDPAKGWVTWGHANNRVPTNIATPFTLSTGLKVWLAMTTNGAHPVQVLSCVLAAGSDVPADIGGTETTPPTTVHFLLGSVGGAGTVESPWSVFSSGQGNLRLETYVVGTVCQTYSPGPPPVPASIKSTYATRVVRV